MKNMKKALSLLLVLCMLAALGVSALAEGKTYLMLGDSVAIYCGIPTQAELDMCHAVYTDPSRPLPGTYSEMLGNDPQLGITNVCNCAHPGWRVQEALYALGGTNYTADYILRYGGDTEQRMLTYSPKYVEALKNADVISINLGSNNVIQPLVYGLYSAFEKSGIAFSGSGLDQSILNSLERIKANSGDIEALITLVNALETTDRGIVLLKSALKMMPSAVTEFQKSWDELMKLIYEVNPDANVIVFGLFNPIGNLIKYTAANTLSIDDSGKFLTDSAAWILKEVTDPVVDAMNLYLRSGNVHARKYVYVDVSDVKLNPSDSRDGVHLDDVGHRYFYDKMKSAIVTNFSADFPVESVPATKTTPTGLLGKLFSGLKNLF